MNVWLIHIGETLPIDGPVRPFRYGLLAEALIERGDHVTRWAPTFSHATKSFRARRGMSVTLSERYEARLLHAGGYRRHVGLARLLFNRRLTRAFRHELGQVEQPDLIVAALPTPELADVAVRYGQERGLPVVVDVRDLWPQVLVDHFPNAVRPFARQAFASSFNATRRALSGATAVYGISRTYLDWGLRLSDRCEGPTDRVYPLAYRQPQLTKSEHQHAREFWDSLGVTSERHLRCCYFGSMNNTCDIDSVVKAARDLDRSGVEFVLCGEGPRLAEFRRQTRHLSNIVFAGWVDQPEIAILMERSDLGLATYAAGALQSIPNKPVEYLAGGLPIVSSLTGELARLIEQTGCGLNYVAGDANSLAGAILGVGHQATAMRSAADELYLSRFNAKVVYPEMANELAELATDSKRQRGQFARCA